ncbi:MAG: hypothetical protein KGM17_00380 [Sphingomonadales bacterium]|nr:hypothetical protein [Sphingomonadales bacterium]
MTFCTLDVSPRFIELARDLDASPDYRVLRRLPRFDEINIRPVHSDGLTKLAILDCETTGLDTARDQIIELAITPAEFNADGELVKLHPCRSWLEGPAMPLNPQISEITGLYDTDLDGECFDDDLIQLLTGLGHPPIV